MSTTMSFWMRGFLSALLATSFGLAGACAAGEAPADEATEGNAGAFSRTAYCA